jgi:signal transduction histidine kinase
MAECSDDQRAEALNNLAFAAMVRMEYHRADSLLNIVSTMTDNQLEILVAAIQQMRLCQRRSANREFYEYREKALVAQKRISEERNQLDAHQRARLRYAESEMAIVTSTYYYYVGLERQSIDALQQVDIDDVRHDTAQYLNYLYNVGAGGILTNGTAEDIYQEEMDFLSRCLTIARRYNYPYFEAQAKESMAEHTGNLQLAEEALQLFTGFGDVYQIAGAHRTLASCFHSSGDERQALEHLQLALSDSAIYQAPDLVASIREQLSVVYAALDDKTNSDYNRKIYIDLQEQTRQDRELEARAGILDTLSRQLNWMILAVVCAIVLMLLLLWLFNRLNRKSMEDHRLDNLLEQKTDELRMRRMSLEKSERRNLEQRAKVSLVVTILPLIDRIRHAISHLSDSQMDYVRELTDTINDQNNLLTQWIQLRQGELSLHIESFPLQPLFDILSRAKTSFQLKGIDLSVHPTAAVVKADRVLTLFMLNTLADNARKFTDRGGSVSISATEHADSIELSVQDSGCGMSAEQLARVFDHKVAGGHGFGLMNCKGIIEKYRKMSQLFSVCQLSAESEEGRGSRFFFRLPKGIVRLVAGIMVLMGMTVNAQGTMHNSQFTDVPSASADHLTSYIEKAHLFADSAYSSNVRGDYRLTLQYADSCRYWLNQQYLSQYPKGQLLMTADGGTSVTPVEIQWLHDGVNVNYQIILDIRNESAVAALALHEWSLYAYNNKVYTQLFKELSADSTLADYCRALQQSQTNKRIAVIMLIVTLLLIVPAYYMLYYRHRLYRRQHRERMQMENIEMTDDELHRIEYEDSQLHVVNAVLDNCLSTLKHETMYYPSRIRQLADSGDVTQLAEVTDYYRDLYAILSEQACRQVELVKLHVRRMELYGMQVLGDANLLHYLFELLKPIDVQAAAIDDKYVQFTVTHADIVPQGTASASQQITRLLCRQIVRDHGEATHRRACGIKTNDNVTIITLPRYNGQV